LESLMPKSVVICDTEPVAIEGVRAVLDRHEGLQLLGADTSLFNGMELVRRLEPSVAVIDKAFGIHAVMDWMRVLRACGNTTSAIVWGIGLSDAEALRLLQAGAMGVIRKTAGMEQLVSCIRAVAAGKTWMEESLFRDGERAIRGQRSNLTGRELQVLELVEQGMRNKDIGNTLGIQAGTVKIHLKHIFEKTGIRGRYGLAVSGLKERGLLSLPTV
jgi:two-component system, NarL family, nitrate/nitrite response regulator NarL